MKRNNNIPEYSVLRMRDEAYLCTEAIPSGGDRFRRISAERPDGQLDAYYASDLLVEHDKKRRSFKVSSVNEQTGEIKVGRTFVGYVRPLNPLS